MKAPPITPTPAARPVPRANTTSTSGHPSAAATRALSIGVLKIEAPIARTAMSFTAGTLTRDLENRIVATQSLRGKLPLDHLEGLGPGQRR